MGNEENNLQDEHVGLLLAGLNRIEAPGDFDFRVRARLAQGKPAVSGPWLPASVRLAVPLGLALLVGGYFAFNSLYSADVPVVAEVGQPAIAQPVPETDLDAALPSNQTIADTTDVRTETRSSFNTPQKNSRPVVRSIDRSGGGSFDEASRVPRRILPRGFDTNANAVSRTGLPDVRMPARDVLTFIGIKARFTSGGWWVESVAPNNIAGRSGVRAGDVIEAVNEQALTETTSFGNNFSGKSLRVRRDGQSVQITLKP